MPTRSLCARKPRKRPAPSSRDQEIYIQYELGGKTQAELAGQHGLTQCRISQIIRRVRAWRSSADPAAERELTGHQQKRLDRWLEHQRLETICREALRHFYKEQRSIQTTRKGTRGDKAFDEQTSRELPANVQWLKVVLRANSELSRLEDKDPLPAEDVDGRQRKWIMSQGLIRLREEAQATGRVTSQGEAWHVVDHWLNALLGQPNETMGDDGLDLAARELSQLIQPESDRQRVVGTLRVPSAGVAVVDERMAVGGETNHSEQREGEAPAEPATHDKYHHSSTYAPPDQSPQTTSGNRLASTPAKQKNSAGPATTTPDSRSPTPHDAFTQRLHRRLAHRQKLEKYYEAVRRGLPVMIEFDPEDGPLPRLDHHLDGGRTECIVAHGHW